MTPKFHKPFSPIIMETEAPKRFVDKINDTADKVLGSEAASVEWDWSHMLVGKVHKEVRIPIRGKEDKQFLLNVMKSACLEYLKESIKQAIIMHGRKLLVMQSQHWITFI